MDVGLVAKGFKRIWERKSDRVMAQFGSLFSRRRQFYTLQKRIQGVVPKQQISVLRDLQCFVDTQYLDWT